MNQLMGRFVLIILLATEGMAMASEPTKEEQFEQLNKEIELLKIKTELLTEQKKLRDAKTEMDSAELQDIKNALSGLNLPEGKKGEITVTEGSEKTALLRSKRPMLELLNEVADTLVKECPEGAVLMTEEQLKKAYASKYTSRLIDEEIGALAEFNEKIKQAQAEPTKMLPPGAFISLIAEVPGIIESVSKLLRVDRELAVFNKEGEAEKIVKHLLGSKEENKIVPYPEGLGSKAEKEAEALWEKRTKLRQELETAKTNLESYKNSEDANATAVTLLEANIKQVSSLLETLDKSEDFWEQVEGLVIASVIEGKDLLFLDIRAQTVQVKESRWYASDRILAIGEVQVLYRLLDANGSVKKSVVILKSSEADNMRLNKLEPINWSRP